MICPNCGNETNGKFCPRCGAKMPAAAPIEPVQNVAPNPVFTPAQPAPQPNAVPVRPAPQPDYAPKQSYTAAPGYVPAQGSNPGQPVNGGSVSKALVDPGDSPARRVIRKLASSPLYLLAVLLFTGSLVLSAIPYVKQIIYYFSNYDYYRNDSAALSTVISMIASVLVMLILALALWSVFFAALRKNPVQMRTGGLTTIKVFLVIALIFMILGLLAMIAMVVFLIAASESDFMGDFMTEADKYLQEALKQVGYTFEETESMSFKTLLIIVGAVSAVICLLVTIFLGKLIKTINTVKRVVRTGHPDDRVSSFAAVLCILSGLANIYPAVNYLTSGKEGLFTGIATACSAACLIFFGILIFQYRGKMRRLGVYRGVSTPDPNR